MLPTKLPQFIWHFVKQHKMTFIVIQLLCLGWSIDNTLWPYGLKLLVDTLTNFTGERSLIWYALLPVMALWVVLWIGPEIMYRISGFMMAKIFPRIEASIRMAMFNYVEGHSYSFFANQFAGTMANRINDMSQSLARTLNITVTLFTPAFVALIIASSIFFHINHWFAVLLMTWVTLHIGYCLVTAPKCARLSNRHSNSRSILTGKVVDSFTNFINVKLFAHRRFEYEYVNTFQDDELKKNQQSATAVEKIKIVLGLSTIIFPGILMTWYEIYCWQHHIISIGDFVLIFNTTWNIIMIMWFVGMELPNLYREIGVCQQALSLIQAEHEIIDTPDAKPLVITQGEIKFDNVSFHYLDGRKVFERTSITIEPGSKVGLVGFSGAGKSTFVNLILRFYDIDSGTIYIDEQDISNVTLTSLRQHISMIPQHPSLFHRTLKENIRYGKHDATDEEVISASKQAHCHEFIMALPQGYDSLVGERGIKLSGGQRQRVAIARAILANAPILILDEATSALDSVTEKIIQESLHTLMKNKTTIVVAHRLSTLADMDRILVFDEGKIVEDGTHQALIDAGEHYAKLWHMQAGGFLPESEKTE